MAVLHFFLVNPPLIYILFSLIRVQFEILFNYSTFIRSTQMQYPLYETSELVTFTL